MNLVVASLVSWLLFNFSLAASAAAKPFPDWLVTKVTWPTTVTRESSSDQLVFSNGLIERRFLLKPGLVTIDYYSHEKKSSLLRALAPEAIISLDGTIFNVGGVLTNAYRPYLNRTALNEDIRADPDSFQFSGYQTSNISARFPYRPLRGAPADVVWPPKGVHLELQFSAPATEKGAKYKAVTATVHYEMYDGHPFLSKWVSVHLHKGADVRASVESVELLHLNWQWAQQGYNWVLVQNDEPHGNLVEWANDPALGNFPGAFMPMLNCSYDRKFSVSLNKAGGSISSFRVMEMVVGSEQRERQGMARRKLLRLLAPHTQENPIYFHITDGKSESFRKVVDQLAEVGFEMLLYSFGSGWDLESNSTAYLESVKADVAYANAKGIEVGGYDLIALTRNVKLDWAALDDKSKDTGSACFASGWYDFLLDRVLTVMKFTNISVLETDGPYGGYSCSSTTHNHHEGESDSVYWQNKLQADFYSVLRTKEVYINQPDEYFFQGGSKTGMGYNEEQYSLPRWLDLSISRQGFFDDTFHYTPTVGWMFLPIEVYHGGGDEAKFEPLEQHLMEYEWGLAQYLGAGVAACYRGNRIYDTPKTRDMVKKWVDFYKKYRQLVTSDIVHVRRGDMQSIDCFLHANPHGNKEKGLAMVFNPTDAAVKTTMELPLYYTGLTKTALLSREGGKVEEVMLDRDYKVQWPIELGPKAITWILISEK